MSSIGYPTYRDSGVEWLGVVPSHWPRPRQLGQISSLKGRLGWQGLKADEYSDEGPFVVSSAHFSNFKIRWDECPRVSQERYELDDNIQLLPGDTLLMKDGAALGKLAFVDDLPGDACLNSHLLLFRPVVEGLELAYWHKFAFYYLQTTLFQEYMQTRGTGATFMGVSQDTISRHQVCWPCYSEQQSIASFLDTETAKIDALVEEQKRLIDLLTEKRQAVISQAVTKGLNRNVPMKGSEVEWLGNVPAHWEVLKASHIGTLFGSDQIEEAMVKDVGSLPYIKVASLDGDGFSIRSWDWFVDPSIEHLCKPKTDFIVFPKRGAAIFLNKVNVVDRPALIDPNLMGWEMNGRAIGRFIAFCLKARRLDELADVSTVPQINNKHVYPEKFPVPPLAEQAAIVGFIIDALARIDELITEAARATHLLHERRSALVSAAVTGKIDVRGLVPQSEAIAA